MSNFRKLFISYEKPSPMAKKVLDFFDVKPKRITEIQNNEYQYHINSCLVQTFGFFEWRKRIGGLGCVFARRKFNDEWRPIAQALSTYIYDDFTGNKEKEKELKLMLLHLLTFKTPTENFYYNKNI